MKEGIKAQMLVHRYVPVGINFPGITAESQIAESQTTVTRGSYICIGFEGGLKVSEQLFPLDATASTLTCECSEAPLLDYRGVKHREQVQISWLLKDPSQHIGRCLYHRRQIGCPFKKPITSIIDRDIRITCLLKNTSQKFFLQCH